MCINFGSLRLTSKLASEIISLDCTLYCSIGTTPQILHIRMSDVSHLSPFFISAIFLRETKHETAYNENATSFSALLAILNELYRLK